MRVWGGRLAHRLRVSGVCGIICLVGTSALSAADKFDGVYAGKRTLVKGSGATCPPEEKVTVTIRGQILTFTDSALKKFTISFDPNRRGSFGEIYSGREELL
jgi:hypothetical protein